MTDETLRMAERLWLLLHEEGLDGVGSFEAVHEHCDANDFVAKAFLYAYGREIEPSDQEDLDRANEALAVVDDRMRYGPPMTRGAGR